jgi:hypothetical protein
LTALNARSLSHSRWAFGCAFLEVCLHPEKPPFSPLRHSLLNSLAVPSTMILRSSLREDPIARPTKPIDSCGIPHAAPAASFLRLYPKRPGPHLVMLPGVRPPGRFR